MSPFSALPEEIILQILTYLDTPAPSTTQDRAEPGLNLTSSQSKTTDYKSLSLVSRLFRRITLPLLLKHSRLFLSGPNQTTWLDCPICGTNRHLRTRNSPPPAGIDAHHAALFDAAHEENVHDDFSTATGNSSTITLQWSARFYHLLKDYLSFLQTNDLAFKVSSFVLLTDKMMQGRHQLAPEHDYRYEASAQFWNHLLSELPMLERVVILAPPADLACLTNCAIDSSSDWAFSDMDFHIASLSMPHPSPFTPSHPIQAIPSSYPGVAPSSILTLRPWTHLSLNEGSFLKAYGTYEYFERGPPSLIYSIKDCLASNRHKSIPSHSAGVDLSALRSFTYTAILPFANHLDFSGILPFLEELDVQLAPDPRSGILGDKNRVGKAELEDCWSEFLQSYRLITRPFQTFEIRPNDLPRLKRFVCRDMRIPALREDLDKEFIPLCLPVWAEVEPGVFQRLCPAATYPINE